ncbi:hypothetical protein [Allosalinactinospora lopnorensis]|nr:hypothetical protein [Allosalinactinospora lopnorensis]
MLREMFGMPHSEGLGVSGDRIIQVLIVRNTAKLRGPPDADTLMTACDLG